MNKVIARETVPMDGIYTRLKGLKKGSDRYEALTTLIALVNQEKVGYFKMTNGQVDEVLVFTFKTNKFSITTNHRACKPGFFKVSFENFVDTVKTSTNYTISRPAKDVLVGNRMKGFEFVGTNKLPYTKSHDSVNGVVGRIFKQNQSRDSVAVEFHNGLKLDYPKNTSLSHILKELKTELKTSSCETKTKLLGGGSVEITQNFTGPHSNSRDNRFGKPLVISHIVNSMVREDIYELKLDYLNGLYLSDGSFIEVTTMPDGEQSVAIRKGDVSTTVLSLYDLLSSLGDEVIEYFNSLTKPNDYIGVSFGNMVLNRTITRNGTNFGVLVNPISDKSETIPLNILFRALHQGVNWRSEVTTQKATAIGANDSRRSWVGRRVTWLGISAQLKSIDGDVATLHIFKTNEEIKVNLAFVEEQPLEDGEPFVCVDEFGTLTFQKFSSTQHYNEMYRLPLDAYSFVTEYLKSK